jgi:FPC/CPF motif-containing protein YcgG
MTKMSCAELRARAIKRTLFHDRFAAFIGARNFPCLGAKAAFNSGSYMLSVYGELAAGETSAVLAKDLRKFTCSKLCRTNEYASFVTIFERPLVTDEVVFEKLLWSQLQQLNQIDARKHGWDPLVSSDPSDPFFSFSFAGQALYVVGLHGASSRQSRRFPWPALVFNPHEQFQRLRAKGKWRRMQDTIRRRDVALQGTLNPMLSDFGERSEAGQYSGRVAGKNWRAPFRAGQHAAKISSGRCPFGH